MVSSDVPLAYQIRVSLDRIRPPIWRRIVVPGGTTLATLHEVLQIVMGWEDYHLHQFTIAGKRYGDREHDVEGELGFIDERRHTLRQLSLAERVPFAYEYDFGDGWEHTLVVEKIVPSEEGSRYPVCLAGKRACPPEDVGGVWGYEAYLEALQDPSHPDHEDLLAWRGEFDPEAFSVQAVNAALRGAGRRRRRTAEDDDWVSDGPLLPIPSPPDGWARRLTPELSEAVEALPLPRDMLAFLAYLRNSRVTGTQSTGNLPLKAAREIASRFVDPPPFGMTIGDRSYPVRSAQDVWPLYFVHVLASVGELASGGRGRRWRLTPAGEEFMQAAPPMQLQFLLATWWTRVNWLLAVPFNFPGSALPPGFEALTWRSLLDLPDGEPVPFEAFADRLVSAAGLAGPGRDGDLEKDLLRSAVERMVMRPLAAFGVLRLEKRTVVVIGDVTAQRVRAFRVSPLGRVLLETLPA